MKSPEILSAQQRTYIEDQLNGLNNAIWGNKEADVWERLDLEEAVKYYLVQELLEDCESYHGSCYLYKDRDRNGLTEKWYFGPVWDFGNAYNRGWDTWIYDSPQFAQYWIGQLATWPQFQAKLKEVWYVFRHDKQSDFLTAINDLAALIEQGAKNDAARWNGTMNYCDNSNMTAKHNEFAKKFNGRTNWLYQQWGEGTKPVMQGIEDPADSRMEAKKVLRNGQIRILRGNKTYNIVGCATDDSMR